MTDHRKLDASLAAALAMVDAGGADLAEQILAVFVHVGAGEPGPDPEELSGLGLPETAVSGQVCTAALSARQVEDLSDRPWVQRLSLSDRLSPLDEC